MFEFSINERIALAYLRPAPACSGAPDGVRRLRAAAGRRRFSHKAQARPSSDEILMLRMIAALQNMEAPLARAFAACLGGGAREVLDAAQQAADELLCLGVALPSPRGMYGRVVAA